MNPSLEYLNNNLAALKNWGENIQVMESTIKCHDSQINDILNWDIRNQLEINIPFPDKDSDPKKSFLFQAIKKSTDDSPLINLEIDNIPLHSRYNPMREGEQIEKTDSTIVLLGCGLGYNLKNLLFSSDRIIIILEPNPILLIFLFIFRDLSTFISKGRLRVIWNATEDNVYRNIKNLENINYNFIPHRACFRLFSEDVYFSLRNIFWNYVEKKGVNLTTLSRFEKTWAKNLISNLNHYLNTANPLNLFWDGGPQPLNSSYNQAVIPP